MCFSLVLVSLFPRRVEILVRSMCHELTTQDTSAQDRDVSKMTNNAVPGWPSPRGLPQLPHTMSESFSVTGIVEDFGGGSRMATLHNTKTGNDCTRSTEKSRRR